MRTPPTLAVLFLLILAPNHFSESSNRVSPDNPEADQSALASSATQEIPTIAFCEMVKNPSRYFDKTVRLKATLKLAMEASYLSDDECVLSHDDQIGVRYVNDDVKQRDLIMSDARKIGTIEYGGRAKVTIVGILRNSSMRSFAWYRYRFDIARFENISQVIVPYEGTLQAGITYRATVRGDSRLGLSLIPPVRMHPHYAVHIEWTNLREFPALERPGGSERERQIVFTVISDQIQQMTERRWNRTIECKIISVD